MINIDQFKEAQIQVGEILAAEAVEGSNKLLKLTVNFNEEVPRQVISGIAQKILPENLINKKVCFVTNLEPREIMGLQSQAMILAASEDTNFALIVPHVDIKAGTVIG